MSDNKLGDIFGIVAMFSLLGGFLWFVIWFVIPEGSCRSKEGMSYYHGECMPEPLEYQRRIQDMEDARDRNWEEYYHSKGSK